MDRKLIMLKSPNLILAGFGALAKMGEEAGNLEAKKALLVTDKGITASGITAKVEKDGCHAARIGTDAADAARPVSRRASADASG